MKSIEAAQNFKTMNCAQSVLLAFSDELNLDKVTAQKIAAGFGGGMGEGETCGAVTGAYMVIGLQINADNRPSQEFKKETKAKVKRFNTIFTEKHGSLKCKYLLGADLTTTKGLEKAKEEDLFNKICPRFVESACQILENEL